MTNKTHPYDPDLPYVVGCCGNIDARFRTYEAAEVFIAAGYPEMHTPEIIDTTPKPRVPDDARIVTWLSNGYRRYAERVHGNIWMDDETYARPFEDLPDVTPDTVFTVLDAREERKSDG